MIGVYKITSPTQKVYVGQSIDIEKRQQQYKRLVCKNQIKLYKSLKKYGWKAHLFEVICECSVQDLNETERYHQDYYNVMVDGLNCKLTATDSKSGALSEDTKSKIGTGNLGKKRTDEEKSKMSKAMKGKSKGVRSEEHKNKLRAASLGKSLTAEHVANIIKSRKYGKEHPMHGKKRPENSERNKARSNKPCMIDGVRYDSVVQAATILDRSKHTLYKRIKNVLNKKNYYC